MVLNLYELYFSDVFFTKFILLLLPVQLSVLMDEYFTYLLKIYNFLLIAPFPKKSTDFL